MSDQIVTVLMTHRVAQEDLNGLACTCGMHFFPNAGPGGLTWHERHLAYELRVALGLDLLSWAELLAEGEA